MTLILTGMKTIKKRITELEVELIALENAANIQKELTIRQFEIQFHISQSLLSMYISHKSIHSI